MMWVITRARDPRHDTRLAPGGAHHPADAGFSLDIELCRQLCPALREQYNASAAGEQAIPFLLLVVGFFPDLVLARDRPGDLCGRKRAQEPRATAGHAALQHPALLGKTLAALIPPVVAALLGIAVYLISLFVNIEYRPARRLVLQIVLLTTGRGLIMVSAAVIISSQTTSVRAANLLASFIILLVAFLVQGEALIMFWARYDLLWFVLLALMVSELILVRMGIRIFNREELLGREIDKLTQA